jgi:serine/threonine protein kinase
MTRHLHEPANALLYRALDLPSDERQRFIADACEGEPELLELVRTLLSRIDLLDEFLEAPLEVPAEPRPGPIIVPRPSDLVGDWRVLRELGRDGMDAILLVERGDGAALQTGTMKIAQVSGQSADTLARFHRERQRLSNLNHPAIARPVDAGSTADGRPYFVMEHSAGVPVDRHCADAKLDLNQRVALFARVCHAVHYAHQHLVIHRDLKPANIVIGPDGAPRLLDFGIAGDSGEPGSWQPAPLFASPEQLGGQPLSISSDIYSLGAILYGLVSGRSPNAAEAAGIISTLARPAPMKPSDAVSQAAERHYPPLPELAADELLRPSTELARQLRGDLDDIILKAIDLDPARRYASADAFAGDLERFLVREPLQATAPARAERRRSLPRRHPIALAAAALVACSLVGVTVAALWHARTADLARAAAEQRSGQAGRPASGMQAEVGDALTKTPAAGRDKFVGSAQVYLGQLADVRRGAGDLAGAKQAAAMALGFAEKQAQSHPDDVRWRRQLSAARGQLGAILVEQGRTADGLAELRKALAMREELAAKDAGNESAAREVADAHLAMAAAMMATLDYPAAEQEMALAHATYATQLRANPADAAVRAGLIELELARANVQNLQHHGRDAVTSLAALHALAADASREPVDAHVAARIALLDAHIQPRGTPARAYAAAEQALAELLKQTEKDPLDTYQLRESALAWQQTGEIGLRARQAESACRYLGLAAKRYDEFGASQRLNAIDKLRQGQVEALRKACG